MTKLDNENKFPPLNNGAQSLEVHIDGLVQDCCISIATVLL